MAILYRLAMPLEQEPDCPTLKVLFKNWWQSENAESWDVSEESDSDLWMVSGLHDSQNRRRRANLGVGVVESRRWLWFEISLPDHVVCKPGDLEPAPPLISPLFSLLHDEPSVQAIWQPIRLTGSDKLDEAITTSRSKSQPSFFLTSEVSQPTLTRVQEVIWSYIQGLGTTYIVDPELFPEAKTQLGLRWMNPGMAAMTSANRTRAIPAAAISKKPEPGARFLQSYGLEPKFWQLPNALLRRRRLLEISSARESGNTDELWQMLEDQSRDLEAAQSRLESVTLDLYSATEDLQQTQEDLINAEKANRTLRWQLSHPTEPEIDHEDGDDLLDLAPTSCTDVLYVVPDYMENILITADFSFAEILDTHEHAASWASTAWNLLAAANDYVSAKNDRGFQGDLFRYATSPPDHNIPLPVKRLSLTESESTQINRALRRVRTFPVPREIDSSGEHYMDAHFKIGNGSPAPRIHFLDASASSIGKIIVGYFGPHLDTGGH